MEPILEELRTEYRGALEVDFIDVKKDREAAMPFGIRVIPTQVFLDAEGESTSSYMEASTAYLRVVDSWADQTSGVLDTVSVTVTAALTDDFETVLLTETGTSTGVFEGELPLDVAQLPSAEDGLLTTTELSGPPVRFDVLAPCPADVDGDAVVGFTDLLAVLIAWGCEDACAEDVDGDGTVGASDLFTVIGAWGVCAD